MQAETRFKRKVLEELDKIPNLWYEKIQEVAKRGVPDIIGVVNGRCFLWELKTPGKKATKLQARVLYNWARAGALSRVITPGCLDSGLAELRALSRGTLKRQPWESVDNIPDSSDFPPRL